MAKFLVQNGAPLYGVVQISGAKNAVLPEMASAILTKEMLRGGVPLGSLNRRSKPLEGFVTFVFLKKRYRRRRSGRWSEDR